MDSNKIPNKLFTKSWKYLIIEIWHTKYHDLRLSNIKLSQDKDHDLILSLVLPALGMDNAGIIVNPW